MFVPSNQCRVYYSFVTCRSCTYRYMNVTHLSLKDKMRIQFCTVTCTTYNSYYFKFYYIHDYHITQETLKWIKFVYGVNFSFSQVSIFFPLCSWFSFSIQNCPTRYAPFKKLIDHSYLLKHYFTLIVKEIIQQYHFSPIWCLFHIYRAIFFYCPMKWPHTPLNAKFNSFKYWTTVFSPDFIKNVINRGIKIIRMFCILTFSYCFETEHC